MAHHYVSDCKQCYRYQQCMAEMEIPSIHNKRVTAHRASGKPFMTFVPSARKEYQNWWRQNGRPIGMDNHDCFKSEKAHERELERHRANQIIYREGR